MILCDFQNKYFKNKICRLRHPLKRLLGSILKMYFYSLKIFKYLLPQYVFINLIQECYAYALKKPKYSFIKNFVIKLMPRESPNAH